MGQSLKAVLQLLLIVTLIGAFCAWAIPERPDGIVWAFRMALPLASAPLLWVLIREMRRKEILPDLLREVAPNYFERDGLCFALVPTVNQGVCWVHLFFQNRYERGCAARVVCQPPRKSFSFSRGPLPGIDVSIECDGAAFGVVRIPWPIPAKFQGKKVSCDVACNTFYPSGRGKLLRFREGMRAGSAGGGAARAAVTVGLLLVGEIHVSRPASLSMRLPTEVVEELPPGLGMETEILWMPDLAADGFPLEPGGSMPPAQS